MDAKKIRKGIGRFFIWLVISFCSLILKFMPSSCVYGLAHYLAGLAYLIARKQRKIALESLTIAFGQEKTKQEIERIVKDCFACMAKAGTELVFLLERPHLLRRQVEFVGKDNFDSALAQGRGVILVSAHFGNFPLLLARLSLAGHKAAGIMRPMRDSRTERLFMAQRNRFGVKTIYSQPRKACVEETIRALRNNEIVFIPIDQNFGTGGVFVDFFGQKAATATGPVVLAQRTQAVILPCFIVRQKDNTHKIIFEKPLELEKGSTSEETVLMNIQKLTKIIESYIRRYPAEWGWIHRRWKTKPN
ncbi:MAG: lysophospholipid acyltransferase family protein [Candidatus Omnitrophica bacterium]|nr:lysophospholipid acyltransferase family protein [Candidatus Omnitrophota bacterium]